MSVERVPTMGDIRIETYPTVTLLVAVTEAGRRWLREQTQWDRESMWFASGVHRGIVIPPQRINDFIKAAYGAGLEVR